MQKTHQPPKEPGHYWVQLRDQDPPRWVIAQVLTVPPQDGTFALTCSHHIFKFEEVRWWWDQKIIEPPG